MRTLFPLIFNVHASLFKAKLNKICKCHGKINNKLQIINIK